MRIPVSEKELESMVSHYKQGLSFRQIASKMNNKFSESIIKSRLEDVGIHDSRVSNTGNRIEVSSTDLETIIRLYKEGTSFQEIANILGEKYSVSVIRKRLIELGIHDSKVKRKISKRVNKDDAIPFPDADLRIIVDLYEKGTSFEMMATRFNDKYSHTTIRTKLVEVGVHIPFKRKSKVKVVNAVEISHKDYKAIVKLYGNGVSFQVISNTFQGKYSAELLRYRLTREGVHKPGNRKITNFIDIPEDDMNEIKRLYHSGVAMRKISKQMDNKYNYALIRKRLIELGIHVIGK